MSQITEPRDTGGPAFPHPDYLASGWEGMTLRDYFAAKAMQGVMGMSGAHIEKQPLSMPTHAEDVARIAYEVADAMLAERAKP